MASVIRYLGVVVKKSASGAALKKIQPVFMVLLKANQEVFAKASPLDIDKDEGDSETKRTGCFWPSFLFIPCLLLMAFPHF